MATKLGRSELEAKLKEWGIEFSTVEHPEVFTVEQALPHISHVDGIFAKNLFLKDKKKQLFLLCAAHDAEVKLNDLTKRVGASGCLRFADEKILEEKLGLTQGAVTIFGIINDVSNDVQLVVDSKLLDGTYANVFFHPMVNSATVGVDVEGIKTFLQKTNHDAKIINMSGES